MLNTSDTVRSTQSIDGRILLDVRHGRMFTVNPVGSKILELLDQGQDETRIVDEISRAYGMNIEVVRPDVHDFIEALYKHHIVTSTDAVDPL
jgi:Coenzyme PQQ synthesis protein D (PqqD)